MDVLLGTFGCLRRAACAAALYEQLLRHDARCDAVLSALPGVMALAGATELLMPRDTAAEAEGDVGAKRGCRLGLLDVLPCCITRVWFDAGQGAAAWVCAQRFRCEFPDEYDETYDSSEQLVAGASRPRRVHGESAEAFANRTTATGDATNGLATLYAEFGAQLKHVNGVAVRSGALAALAAGLTRPDAFRTLQLEETPRIYDAELLAFLAACPRVTTLHLMNVDIGDRGLGAIAQVLGRHLRHLVLNCTEVGGAPSGSEGDEYGVDGDGGIAALAAHCGPTLRSLDVSGTYLSQAELMLVATRFPNMRSLVIEMMEGDLDANALTAAALSHMPRLQQAYLEWTGSYGGGIVPPYTAEQIAGFVAPSTLTSLSLTRVTLPAWPPGLVSVDFSHNANAVRNGGLAALAACCGATLRDVNVSHTSFSLDFAAIRAVCERCPRLRSLWARAQTLDKHMSDAECDCIADCPAAASGSLEFLDVAVASPNGVVALLGRCAGLQVLIAGFASNEEPSADQWDAALRGAGTLTALAVASPALRAVSLFQRHCRAANAAARAIERGAVAAGAPRRPQVRVGRQ
jgi:hypothetical protein